MDEIAQRVLQRMKSNEHQNPQRKGGISGDPIAQRVLARLKPQKQDVRQSDNYKNAVANAERYQQEAKKAASPLGFAMNALKASPRAAADVAIGYPSKFLASAVEAPIVGLKREYTNKTYKVPGLSPFKSFQSDFGDVESDVISGKKGLGSAAWSLAQIPLAGVETATLGGGLTRAAGAFKGAAPVSEKLSKAGREVASTYVPMKTEAPPRTLRTAKAPKASTKPLKEGTSPLLQEARKYESEEEFVKAQGTPIYHGTNAEFSDFSPGKMGLYGRGNYFYTGKEAASNHGKKVVEAFVKPGKMATNADFDNALLEAKRQGYKSTKKYERATEIIKENGYIGIKDRDLVSVFDNADIKTKSQLTDIWKQAQGGQSTKGGRIRGHINTIANSPEVSADMSRNIRANAGTIATRKQEPIVRQAQKLIFENIDEAERIARQEMSDRGVIIGDELVKHYDSIAISAKNKGDMKTFNLAMDKARDLVDNVAPNLTESARALSAANRINKASPEFVVGYVQKVAKSVGSETKIPNEKMFSFMRQAEAIQGITDPRARALKTFELIDDIADTVPTGAKHKLAEALNLPRALMATADFSAPLRQGIFVASRNPKTFAKNFSKMFKYAFSEKAYRNLKADILTSPNFHLYQKYKLPLTDISSGLSGREETFMSRIAEKIPGFGGIVRGSDRAYSGFLNKMRVDLFDDFVNTAKLNGIKEEKFFDDAAKFVGAATGRGRLFKSLEGAAPLLNGVFFSPRLIASRMTLLNPAFYAKLHPTVRKEAFKSLAAFVGTGVSVLTLAKLNGAEVGDDPRSADFGKIKIGDTRYDIWGGFQPYARFIGQFSSGEKISTVTGKQTTLGEGYGTPTRKSITEDFFYSKEAPVASFIDRMLQGTKYGEEFNAPVEVINRFIPMVISDAYELQKERGLEGLLMASPAPFGVGIQTYGDQIPMISKTPSNAPTLKWRQQPSLGEDIYNSATGKELTTIPENLQKELYDERKQDNLRQMEVDAAKARVLETGESEMVGTTLVYLKDGIIKTKKIGDEKRTPLKDKILYEEIKKMKTDKPFFTP